MFEGDNPGTLSLFKIMTLSLVVISHTHTDALMDAHTHARAGTAAEWRFLLPVSPGS